MSIAAGVALLCFGWLFNNWRLNRLEQRLKLNEDVWRGFSIAHDMAGGIPDGQVTSIQMPKCQKCGDTFVWDKNGTVCISCQPGERTAEGR